MRPAQSLTHAAAAGFPRFLELSPVTGECEPLNPTFRFFERLIRREDISGLAGESKVRGMS
jgi:hypothetical protein